MSGPRQYAVFLRGVTPGITGDAFGTVSAYRDGIWHQPVVAKMPAPQDSFVNDFGVLQRGSVLVELVDDPAASLADNFLLLDDGTYLLLDDGTPILLD